MLDFVRSTTSWQVKLTIWGVGGLGCINIWRAISLAQQSQLLSELGGSFSPVLRLIIDIGWAGLLITLAILLGSIPQQLRWLVPLVLAMYGLYRLGMLFFFALSAAAHQGWGIYLLVYLVGAFFAYWALTHPQVKGE